MFKYLLPFSLFSLGLLSCNSTKEDDPQQVMQEVYEHLKSIKSASFYSYGAGWYPGDEKKAKLRLQYQEQYDNPQDTTIGTNFVSYLVDGKDHKKLSGAYDGKKRLRYSHEKKEVVFDDFSTRKLPFRPMSTPFLSRTKLMLEYILTTQDSIECTFENSEKELIIDLMIHEDQQIEFFGKACRLPKQKHHFDPTSHYKIWIDKKSKLPYKVFRQMETSESKDSLVLAKVNLKLPHKEIVLTDYIPEGYEVTKKKKQIVDRKGLTHSLLNKPAATWKLYDADKKIVKSDEIDSKAILLQFTGIGCGPCTMSIPFLNLLNKKYSPKELKVVSVETWSKKSSSLKNYIKRNNINYTMLIGDDIIAKDYHAQGAVPLFMIIDQNRNIVNVFMGYGEGNTDLEITKVIDQIIKK